MPTMARPRSQQHELKRDEILDVAAQCFARKSYPAASMNDIAVAGGTSKARLYHYYGSKDAILFDLLDRYTQRCWPSLARWRRRLQRRNLDDRATCMS
jgi:AcrR family transcriptional regulator